MASGLGPLIIEYVEKRVDGILEGREGGRKRESSWVGGGGKGGGACL